MARPRLRFALLALALLAAAAPAAAHADVEVGISDQQASTFTNPLFAPLDLGIARYIAPYDVMSDKTRRKPMDAWLKAAHAADEDILVAFEHSYVKSKATKPPTIAAYTKALQSFKKKYPYVKAIQPWNEANRCQRVLADGGVVGQPICHDPEMAAEYYMAARKVFPSAKVTGLDILDQEQVASSVRYVKDFLKYAKPRPKYWGVHNYSDTNRFSQSRTKALIKATGSGEIWLTETGGIVRFPPSFPLNTKRAAKALGCMFTIAKSNSRITRLYIYQFNGAPANSSFDAGLISVNGHSIRQGYNVVKDRKTALCHP
ncbi:MAG TPA: hypothetical protein VHB30_10630 [Solirubrobacteraceae bacterium]|jgi:hypothetical protein|nr:hypothetical protein [Solirubrobacteraceae bacterium]